MSQANLQRFLEYLVADLESQDIDFRRSVANKKEHVFTTSGARLAAQTLKELDARDIKPSSIQKAEIRAEANKTFKQISTKVQNILLRYETKYGLSRHKDTKFTDNMLVAVFQTASGHGIKLFEKVKTTYTEPLQRYYLNIRSILMDQDSKFTDEATGQFFHGGHAQDMGVFESRVSDAVQGALEDIGDIRLLDFIEGSQTKVAYTLRAIMSKDTSRMSIIIESKHENVEDGKKVLKKRNLFIDAANQAIDKITRGKGFAYFKGSDSPLESRRKQAIAEIEKHFRTVKSAKVKMESTKANPSKGSAKLNVKYKTEKRAMRTAPPKLHKTVSKAQSTKFKLIALINAKLPEAMQRNMVYPRLVWRTGTLGTNTKVTHIDQTKKDYPRVHFTYPADPYRLFELGSTPRFTPERDPKLLIDKSIRDVAKGILGERFYTSRSFT